MTMVRVKDGEDINRAIKRFKRKVEQAGILKEIKMRRAYLKPSVKRRLKQALARKRRNRARRREQARAERM